MRKFIALFMSMIVGSSIAMSQFNVDVQFWNNGKQQVLNNDFEIYFVYEYEDQSKVIYKPNVFMKNQIVLPSGIYSKDAYKDCSILFRYKGKVYYCATFRTKDIYDISTLVIHLQEKPFYKFLFWTWEYGEHLENIMESKFYKYDEYFSDESIIGEVSVILFTKNESTESEARFTPIRDFEEYFRKGEKLLEL